MSGAPARLLVVALTTATEVAGVLVYQGLRAGAPAAPPAASSDSTSAPTQEAPVPGADPTSSIIAPNGAASPTTSMAPQAESWFAPASGTSSATPQAAVAATDRDPVAALTGIVNLPAATVQPPPDATLLYAAVTASFLPDRSTSLTWSYDASVPAGPDRATTLAGSVDTERWRPVSTEPGSIQVGPDLLDGTTYRYEPRAPGNGSLQYSVLDRPDGTHLVQVVHRNLVASGSIDPASVAPPLTWLRSLPMPDNGSVVSLVLHIQRSYAADPWSGSLAVSVRVPGAGLDAVLAALTDATPVGFTSSSFQRSSSQVVYRAVDGTTVTAEVYTDGGDVAVEWYAWIGPSNP